MQVTEVEIQGTTRKKRIQKLKPSEAIIDIRPIVVSFANYVQYQKCKRAFIANISFYLLL